MFDRIHGKGGSTSVISHVVTLRRAAASRLINANGTRVPGIWPDTVLYRYFDQGRGICTKTEVLTT